MKFQSIYFAVMALLTVPTFAANGTMKGDGSVENPFQIEDYEDLKAIGKGDYLYASNYVVTADIDASPSAHEMCDGGSCNGFISIGKKKDAAGSYSFNGNIDGRNHTIRNLNIWLPCEDDVGFISILNGSVVNLDFDRLNVTGRVSEANYVGGVAALLYGNVVNVHVTNAFVQGHYNVGGIAGRLYGDATLKDASFQGEVIGQRYVGGLVGESNGIIDNVSSLVNITATSYDVGGIVGYINKRGVRRAFSRGTIMGDAANVGGIAGKSYDGFVVECVSMMDLMHSHLGKFESDIGGIVGENEGLIAESYFIGNVEGGWNVGGVAGSNEDTLRNVYAIGTVKGDSIVGGLVGKNYRNSENSYIVNSYTVSVVKGDSAIGGLVGVNEGKVGYSYWNTEISGLDTSAGGTGLTTARMMQFSSYAGWDTLGYREYEYVQRDSCDGYALDSGWCYRLKDEMVHYWDIEEGKSFPYLVSYPHIAKVYAPIASPTAAAKWQERPKVASLLAMDGELVGEWLDWINTNDSKDSLYYGYRIGVVNGSDTVWGTSSYMAVPNKIEISTLAELKKIGYDPAYPLAGNYELTADINGLGADFKPIGDSVHVFSGSFDGKNHTIKNLLIGSAYRDFSGLFGYAEKAIVKNLKLSNMKVMGDWYVGALAGVANYALIENVVSLDGNIQGWMHVGGLIGKVGGSEISMVGTTGKVKGEEEVGGLIGSTGSKITNAFSVNVVKGFEDVGGIVGYYTGSFSFVQNVYSASLVKGRKEVEGLIGYPSYDSTRTSYFDSTVTGLSDREGRTTAEMLTKSTYKGFDFDSVWNIQEGISYPYFKGMSPVLPGTLEDDGSVNMLAGLGTAERPYKINDYGDLKYIGKYEYGLDKHYKLIGNIDASASARENCNADSTVCKGFEPFGEFSGVFDGNNKVIAGLEINRPDEDSVGLFRVLASGAKVSGVVFDTASYFGESYTYHYNRAKGSVLGKNYAGVLAGVDNGAELEKIYVNSKVSGENYVGGIIGKKTSGSISLSASRDTVSGKDYVGGLAGGLVSSHVIRVTDCYSLAMVFGVKDVGGLTGYSNTTLVKNSFGAGNVVGTSKFGGLVGEDIKSAYTSVYYDSTFWLVTTTAMGELRNTHQMVKQENYEGWDFENTWKIAADTSYPYLAWVTKGYYIGSTVNQKVVPDKYRDSTMMHLVGSGTESDPFIIKTYGDLKSIGLGKYKLSSVYRLANDIDASASKNEVVDYYRSGFKPIGAYRRYITGIDVQDSSGAFTGKIHGAGHSIMGLYISTNKYSSYPVCFIDSIGSAGVIDSLSLFDFEIQGQSNAAAIAILNEGTIKNVSLNGIVETSDYGAGFVQTNNGVVENVSFTGKVFSQNKKDAYTHAIAGFVAKNNGAVRGVKGDLVVRGEIFSGAGVVFDNAGTIENANVHAMLVLGADYAGGIAAKNSGIVSACTASVSITSTASYVGGLIGYDEGILNNSDVTGYVEGVDYVGGFIGYADGKKDFASYHTSMDVVGKKYVGGLLGWTSRNISKSSASGEVKGSYGNGGYAGGLVGYTNADIDSSYSTASVEYGAGLAGFSKGNVTRCHAEGSVTNGAGLVHTNEGTIRDSYTTGLVKVGGGLVYQNSGSGVIEKSYSSAMVENGAGFIHSNEGSVTNSYATGKIKNGAGFAVMNDGSITECYATGDSENNSAVYGGAGFIWINYKNGVVERCYAKGDIYVTQSFGAGFAKENDGIIRKCFATGDVIANNDATNSTYQEVAGFVSLNRGTVEMSFATGNVEGRYAWGGGFAGHNTGAINNSYATGNLKRRSDNSADSISPIGIASFIGYNEGKVDYDYATGYFEDFDGRRYCSTQKSRGGGVAFFYNSDSCTVRESAWVGNDVSDADLHKKATFKNFDFDSVWYINDGITYPLLRGMPNVPVATAKELVYETGESLTQKVRNELLAATFVLDSTAKKVVEFNPTSASLLDSLEKANSKSANVVITYDAGVLYGVDTIWCRNAKAEIKIDKTTGIPDREITVAHKSSFGAAFQGGHIALRFEIPRAGSVKFNLLDMQGRIVKKVHLGNRAAGAHFETLAAESLARGRYIGVLQVDGKVMHKTLLLKK